MRAAYDISLAKIKAAGANLKSMTIPHVDGRERYFPVAMSTHLLAWLGEDTFLDQREKIDPIIRARIEKGLAIKAHDYLALAQERQQHIDSARSVFDAVDVVISPTTQGPPRRVEELNDSDVAMQAAMGMTRNTQPANYFDWCAVTLPMGISQEGLPLACS
ncbi:amidase family protein [Modicisalibacter luteus]|uniref:amidase family protein n=1 Tax=Modicisalibacter luteus TaxID=453962 RepID=UPI003642FA63